VNIAEDAAERVRDALLTWYAASQRKLPWRETSDAYAILVSEVMLQQTQVERVIPVYHAFLQRFPTFEALAAAPPSEVIRAWAGMGYNRRALNLQRAAQAVVERHGGALPHDPAALRALPGVGEYTANALACFALGEQTAVVDTNVRRVLGRVFHWPAAPTDREVAGTARRVLPEGHAWSWNQALMDLGATVCTSRRPTCLLCPLRESCRAAGAFESEPSDAVAESRAAYRPKTERFEGSSRYYRGRVVAHLRGLPDGASCPVDDLAAAVKPGYSDADAPWLRALLNGLARDGLVALHGEDEGARVSLP
jgi:A/G-specific adenine glycosylase